MSDWERPSLSSDSGPRGTRTRSEKAHRLRWPILAAAVVAAVGFGWISWRAYTSGGANNGAIVPLLKADTEPTRIRPENPGGMTIPNQDKAIYDELDPRHTPPKGVERLLPPPETPVSRPPAVAAKEPADDETAPDAKPSIPTLSEGSPLPAREVTTPKIKAPVEPEPASPPKSASAPSPFTKLEAPPPSKPAAKAPHREQSASVSPSSPPAKSAAGSVHIQLGAVSSQSAAQKAWERIRHANSDLLGSLSPNIVRADLGAKGVVYRIQAGPVASADAAANLCAKLKTRNVGCFVAH